MVAARRSDQPWSRSFRLYLVLGAVAVLLRVLSRVVLGGYPGTVLLDLPEIPLPDWVLGIRLLGPLTRESLLSGLYDGMRLGAILVCVGRHGLGELPTIPWPVTRGCRKDSPAARRSRGGQRPRCERGAARTGRCGGGMVNVRAVR